MLKLVIGHVFTELYGLLDYDPVLPQLRAALNYYAPDYETDPRYLNKTWDGKEYLINYSPAKGCWVCYAGLTARLLGMLQLNGKAVEVVKLVPKPVAHPDLAHWQTGETLISTRLYQSLAAVRVLKQEPTPGGVIHIATGGGKTRTAAKLTQVTRVPTVVFVNQKDLQQQFIDELGAMLGCPIGILGDGKRDLQPVTVATVQTVFKYQHDPEIVAFLASRELAIFDECHIIATATCAVARERVSSARIVVGMSASPWRDDGKDLLIEALVGPIVYSVSATELIRQGYLVAPTIRIHKAPKPVPEMPLGPKSQFAAFYKAWVVLNQRRNDLICRLAAEHAAEGRVSIVLVKQVDHGHMLAATIPGAVFMHGTLSKKARSQILDDVRIGMTRVLIATSLADQGLDIPIASGLILAGGGKSSTKALQRIGRVLRLSEGKLDARVDDIEDDHGIFKRHMAARMKLYRTEPAFKIMRVT